MQGEPARNAKPGGQSARARMIEAGYRLCPASPLSGVTPMLVAGEAGVPLSEFETQFADLRGYFLALQLHFLDELRARYARQAAGRSPDGREEWRNWILRREPGGEAVGYVQATISGEGRRAEIAWVVGLAWQGQGYATEAARALVGWLDARGAGVIQARIHPEHAASAAVARRAGLRPSGVIEDGEQVWLRDRPAAR